MLIPMNKKFTLLFLTLCCYFISSWTISDLSWAQWADTLTVIQQNQSNWFPTSETRWQSPLIGEWIYRLKGEKHWRKIQLPHTINACPTKKAAGIWFFRRTFVVPNRWQNKRWYLVLNGVNSVCDVRINNRFVGYYTHGYCPVVIPLDDNLVQVAQRNEIELKIDTRFGNRGENLLPHISFLSPCRPKGIFRDLFFYIEPGLGLSKTKLQFLPNSDFSKWTLRYEVEIAAKTLQQELPPGAFSVQKSLLLELQIADPDANNRKIAAYSTSINVFSDTANVFTGEFKLKNIIPWSPTTPKIYHLDIYLKEKHKVLDHLVYKIGFRHIEIREGSLWLNGKPVTIHGVTVVEGVPLQRKPRFYVTQAKSLNANAIYWPFPPSPEVLDECDQTGLLSIVGLPLWNTPGVFLQDKRAITAAKAYLASLQLLIQFHPSVLSISLGSGFDLGHSGSLSFLQSVTSAIKLPPGTVPLMAGFRTTDFVPDAEALIKKASLGLIYLNLTDFRKSELTTVVQRWRDILPPQTGLLVEIGAPYIQSRCNSEDVSNFETQQAHNIQQMLINLNQDQVAGEFVLALADWRAQYPSILTPCNSLQIFPFGLMNQNCKPRMAWKVVQNFYRGNSDATLLPLELGNSEDEIFILWGFGVLILFAYFFRRDYRFRGNFIRVLVRPRGFFSELKEARKIFLSHSLLTVFIAASTLSLILAGLFYHLRESVLFDFILSLFSIHTDFKRQLVTFIWHPTGLIALFTLGIMLCLSVFAGYLKLLSMLASRFVPLRNTFTFIFWLSGIFVFLLPIALSFVRLINFPQLHLWSFLLIMVFVAWFIYRIFIGIQIMCDLKPGIVAIILLSSLLILTLLFYWAYDYHISIKAHLGYLYHIWKYGHF